MATPANPQDLISHAIDRNDGQLLLDLITVTPGALEMKTRGGHTPLALCLMRMRLGLAKLLINNGADVNTQDNSGRTPVFHALGALNIFEERVIDPLVAAGADLSHREKDGYSLLACAVRICRPGGIRVLMDAGCHLTDEDFIKDDPITLARRRWPEEGQLIADLEAGLLSWRRQQRSQVSSGRRYAAGLEIGL